MTNTEDFDFDIGTGWHEITDDEWYNVLPGVDAVEGIINGEHHWLMRKRPKPLLPTKPGYYVASDGSAWHLDDDGIWDDTFGNPGEPSSDVLPLTEYKRRDDVIEEVIEYLKSIGREFAAADVSSLLSVQE